MSPKDPHISMAGDPHISFLGKYVRELFKGNVSAVKEECVQSGEDP